MVNRSIDFRNSSFYLLRILLPILIYVFVLVFQIPHELTRHFANFSLPYFLLVLIVFYLSFRVKGEYDWLLGACFAALIYALRLSFLWSSGYSNDMIIGGLLPFRDGYAYYFGARLITDGSLIVPKSVQASWRPLYSGFISSLFLILQHNFKMVMAMQVGLLSLCSYLSAYILRHSFGKKTAALFATLLYFYIQPMIGLLYSEIFGFTVGCLGFILLWNSIKNKKISHLAFGLIILMIAVSARAGTFFIFPGLAIWAGWSFRKKIRFSVPVFVIAVLVIGISFLVFNNVYHSLVVEPGVSANDNFAYTIYGQVVGGAGYNHAIQKFGRKIPDKVYRAAWRFFKAHPVSFFIGATKSYRDFFWDGIFGFSSPGTHKWWDTVLLICLLFLTVWGIGKSIRKLATSKYLFITTALAGFCLSIPFLPPIDGGVRFYASTVPFFYLVPSIVFGRRIPEEERSHLTTIWVQRIALSLSIIVLILTVIVPVFSQRLSDINIAEIPTPTCASDQMPFAIKLYRGSYIDIVPENTGFCGYIPRICLTDFDANSEIMDASDIDLFEELNLYFSNINDEVRLFPSYDLLSITPGFYVSSTSSIQDYENNSIVTGCATRIKLKKRKDIFKIEQIGQP